MKTPNAVRLVYEVDIGIDEEKQGKHLQMRRP